MGGDGDYKAILGKIMTKILVMILAKGTSHEKKEEKVYSGKHKGTQIVK